VDFRALPVVERMLFRAFVRDVVVLRALRVFREVVFLVVRRFPPVVRLGIV
jgi:hypothetical protein